MEVKIGKGIALDVDTAKLQGAVLDHVLMIGLRNILMDCHAGITKEDHPTDYTEKSRAKAEEKLAAMYAGDIRKARQSSGVTRDPVRAEAVKNAKGLVNGIFRWNEKDGKWTIKDRDQWTAIFTAYSADYALDTPEGMAELHAAIVEAQADEMMEEAAIIVERREKMKSVKIALPKKG